MNEAFPLGPRRGKCSNSAGLLTGVFVCLCVHMYGHLGVIVMLHLCCESLCGLSFCTCSLHVQMLLVCGSGLLVALSVHAIMCVYVLAMSLGVFGSVSECAFQWDCEFACLPLSFCVSFSVCECLDQLLCVIMHFSVRLSVPFHGPQVFITTPVWCGVYQPSLHSSLAARTWQGLVSWVGPGPGLVGGYGREGGLGGGPY